MSRYLDLDITLINQKLKNKEIKVIDLVNEAILRIEENSNLNAFITLNKEGAIKRAMELDLMEVDNLLFGIPIAIKDNICTRGILTSAGSKILSNFIPVYDATVIKKIYDKNMIIIGKTNMDEFAMGSSNQTSYYGSVLNSIDQTKVPGGSSGGSAVATSKFGLLSLGSDTGGSIRQPAAFNNVVGMKPTYGRISRYGLISFSSSLDQIGPITRSVLDNALLLNALVGKDVNDLTTSDLKEEDFTRYIGTDISNMKVAVPNFYMNDAIEIEIKNKVLKVIELLKLNNVSVEYVDIPLIEYSIPLYQIIALAEASSNLARFDGIKYGYRTKKEVSSELELYKYTRGEGFGDEVKRRIMIGSYVLSGDNANEYYYKALSIRNAIRNNFNEILSKYDLIIGPTTTSFPYNLGEGLTDSIKSFMDDLLTIPVNMAGLPAISLPIGFGSNKLSIGMQIIGGKNDEATIYKLASFIEKNRSDIDE